MLRAFIRLINNLVSIATGLALLLAGLYAGYCLWDNQQIYSAAENVQEELLRLKPNAYGEDGSSGPTFDELLKINPDVRAWVTLDGTKIDYPVLQGSSNIDYLNTDIYGNFALAGSIFLDSRNDPNFADNYSVLYGHHMDKSAMFGDLDKYLDRKFFEANRTGVLMIPKKVYRLRIFASIQTHASDERIFSPDTWRDNASGLLDFAQRNAVNINNEAVNSIKASLNKGEKVKILALTTCSSDFTDARTIVLAAMEEK